MRSWSIGEVFVLRHAGFPFDWLEELGLPASALADVDALLDSEEALVRACRESGGDRLAERAATDIRAGRVPQKTGAGAKESLDRWQSSRKRAVEAYAAARPALREKLRERASDPRVQEAVFLSSPDMFDNVWARYLASPGADNSDGRRVERQIYSYLQRLCAKNETAGFFGPMGYGEVDDGEGVRVERRPMKRRTFIAFSSVKDLAQAITSDKRIWVQLPLRVNPAFRIEPGRAVCPSASIDVSLSSAQQALIAALAEVDSPEALQAKLSLGAKELLALAMPLFKAGALIRELRWRPADLEAFGSLSDALRALPPSEAASQWLARLAALDALRAQFEASDLTGKRATLPKLEAAFTEMTGKPARRGEGQMYVDRLVIYEEASSPFELKFGRAFSDSLGQAISGSLELSSAFGERVQQRLRTEISERSKGQSQTLDLLSFASTYKPVATDGGSQRFASLEPLTIGSAGTVEAEIPSDAAGPSADGGRYALPDVCLEKRPDGSYDVLIARVHHHLLVANWLAAFYPDLSRYERAARRWLEREPTAKPIATMAFTRRNKGYYQFPGRHVLYSTEPALPGARAVSAADLTVELGGDRPVLRDASGTEIQLYIPLADFVTYPPYAALAPPLVLHAPLRAPGERTPRVRIGGALYQRQRWELNVAELSKLNGADGFFALRRLARERSWPRFLFARSLEERKPFLVDLASPWGSEMLRHMAKGGQAAFEEMFPTPEGLFLRDEHGRYTFELRMQAERWSIERPKD